MLEARDSFMLPRTLILILNTHANENSSNNHSSVFSGKEVRLRDNDIRGLFSVRYIMAPRLLGLFQATNSAEQNA